MNRYLLYALAACAVAILFGWIHIEGQAKDLAIATDRITTLNAAAESRRNTQKLLAQLDTEHTKALTDAQAQNKALLWLGIQKIEDAPRDKMKLLVNRMKQIVSEKIELKTKGE